MNAALQIDVVPMHKIMYDVFKIETLQIIF